MTVKLTEASPASKNEIEAFEKVLGVRLPDEYRNFLLSHNDATPEPNSFPVGSDNDSGVNRFVPCSEIVEQMKFVDHVSFKMIPIAEDDCGNYVLLNLDDSGRIYFWDHEEPYEQIELAPGMNAFLELLEPFDCNSVQLKKGQVISSWIDPEFLKELKEKGEID